MKRTVAAIVISLLAVAPVAAEAQQESGAEQSLQVGNEADYRAALVTLSADANGPHTLTLTGDITLAGAVNPEYSGTAELIIDGAGFTLDGGGNSRVIDVTNAAVPQLTVRNITISNGFHGSSGGAVNSTGDVLIDNATLSTNQVDGAGPLTGGAVAGRTVTVTGSNLLTNSVNVPSGIGTARGGAIHASIAASITGSTVTGNTATTLGGTTEGGAVSADGVVDIANSQMTLNRAEKGSTSGGNARGGAVSGVGLVTVTNSSTLTGNVARALEDGAEGGAIVAGAGLTVADSTISDNEAVIATNANAATGGAALAVGPVSITDSTLAGNEATSTANVAGESKAGAVRASGGAVSVLRSTVHDNKAQGTVSGAGGAFYTSTAPLTVTDSLVTDNTATASNGFSQGGAAIVFSTATTIVRSEFRGNMATATPAQGRGGAVFSNSPGASVSITDSALVANTVTTFGGAVYGTHGPLSVVNSTVSGNSALLGGGLHHSGGAVTLSHATVATNTGSVTDANLQANAGLVADRSVVADPLGAGNCTVVGGTTTGGHNVESGVDCGFTDGSEGDVQNATAEQVALGPVRNNGGAAVGAEAAPAARPTSTAYPLQGSILIDAIPAGSCSAAPELDLDQRGVDRPFGAGCDIGAIEAVFPAHGFADSIPFYEATIRWVTSSVNTPQILLGFNPSTFGPGLNIARGDVARMLHRAAGAPTGFAAHGFSDVTPFYEDAVRWAKATGVFNGFPDNTFRLGNPITRADFVRGLYGLAGNPDITLLPPHGFSDVIPFYENAVRWAKGNTLADGFGATFGLGLNIIRGNAARIMYNLAQTPAAWNDTMTAPANMLFKDNTP